MNYENTKDARVTSGVLHAVRKTLGILCALLMGLAWVILWSGCSRGPAAHAPKLREWRAWQLPPEGPSLPTPRSLAVGLRDELAVLDTAGRVTIYDSGGTLLRQWHMLDVSVGKPEGVTILKDGRVVVCDTHYHRIVYFDSNGNWLRNFGSEGTGQGQFIFPVGICKDPDENLYVCEYGGHDRVQKFTRDGEWLAEFGSFGTGSGQFQRPSGLAWLEKKIYVTDAINHRVLIFSDSGKFIQNLGDPKPPQLYLPYDIALDPEGFLNVIEYGAGRLSRFTPAGELVAQFGESGQGTGQFATPWGLTVDSKGRIYVADTKNRRLVAFRF
jgi:DNA-binding beta-propeller fold protein YncE